MSGIVVARSTEMFRNRDLTEKMFRFRHKVFREKLNWEVKSHDGMERDDYDDLNPIYMVSRNSRKEVEGSWRLLPTTGPYMLKDTFPQLLRGEKAPENPAVWEISRFAVSPAANSDRVQAKLNKVTFAMIKGALEFAEENGIRHYVFATSVALERLFKVLGLPVYRFGDRKAQRIGKVLSVACWVDINDQFRRVVYGDNSASLASKEVA